MTRAAARRRDRRVYLAGHPVLFGLLAATRGRAVRRLGGTLLVHGSEEFRSVLTRVPIDRTADGTTGGSAGRLTGGGALFDQRGDDHRQARRHSADLLGADGVDRLRPTWTALLTDRAAALANGGTLDLVPLAAELAGATAAALLRLDIDPTTLAAAARRAGSAAAREHLPGPARLPGPTRARAARRATTAADALLTLLAAAPPLHLPAPACPAHPAPDHPAANRSGSTQSARAPDGHFSHVRSEEIALAAMLAVAAVNTTVAALPRAAAWAGDADLWAYAGKPELASELLRVTSPSPLLPRVAAGEGSAGGCPVRRGDRLLLIARHAAEAHRRDPDPEDPAPAAVTQLVFGAGAHACPGARLARAQTTDFLAALAPYRPVVVHARADRRSALPAWRSLIMRGTR